MGFKMSSGGVIVGLSKGWLEPLRRWSLLFRPLLLRAGVCVVVWVEQRVELRLKVAERELW